MTISPPIVALAFIATIACSAPMTAASELRHPLPVAVARSGAIVIADVIEWPATPSQSRATFRTRRVLKGRVPEEQFRARVPQRICWRLDNARRTGTSHVLLFLNGSGSGLTVSRTFVSDRITTEVERLVAELPAWSQPWGGLSTIAIPSCSRLQLGNELDLHVGHRNVSPEPITLRYRPSPPESRTWWELDVRDVDTDRVVPQRVHPSISPSEVRTFVSSHDQPFELTLAPGQQFFVSLTSVTSARPGHGLKARLGYVHYPIDTPGCYSIKVTSHAFAPGHAPQAESVVACFDE